MNNKLNVWKWLVDIVKSDNRSFIIGILLISNTFTINMYFDQRAKYDTLSDKYIELSESIRKEINLEKDERINELRTIVIRLNEELTKIKITNNDNDENE